MTDPRLTPANARVAAAHLRGRVAAPRYCAGQARRVSVPVADLRRAPGGPRDRQLLMGEAVTLYDTHEAWAFVQAVRDGYVGYLRAEQLEDGAPPTHRVSARATHLYPAPEIGAAEICALSHGSLVHVVAQHDRFAEIPQGFVPRAHLAPLGRAARDPVAVAELYLGAPYLWGGNSAFGIDCSGLVQAGCLTCGIACPGDSDLQAAGLGAELPEDADLRRGDLLFWRGHVAWVADPDTLIHANAFHMAVAREAIHDAVARIAAQGDGPVTARKRLGELS